MIAFRPHSWSAIAAAVTIAGGAVAQDVGGEGSAPPSDANQGPPVTATDTQGNTINITGSFGGGQTQTTTTHTTGYGVPDADYNPDAHLPSSSQSVTDINAGGDGFDLGGRSGRPSTVRGGENGPAILGKKKAGSRVPAMHQVKAGDTMWDLCATHYNNPWMWPKVWSYNPQVQNPHWIYPGDQLRMRVDAQPEQRSSISLGSGNVQPTGGAGGFINRRPLVPRETVFLRNAGYIDDPKKDIWGELVGAHKEQMLLTEGNYVYMIMRPGVNLRLGQLVNVFRSVRTPDKIKGARRPKGEIIAIKGTVKIDKWNPKTRIARGQIVESLDVIERGAKLGPVGRRFDVVPPRRNESDVWARVLTSMYPHEIMGQNQVVFVDKGKKDGLTAGNRLFVVMKGDTWRSTLKTTTKMARGRMRIDVPESISVDYTPLHGDEEDFPEEVVGELRVLRVQEDTALCMVTRSHREIEPGDRVVARKGY